MERTKPSGGLRYCRLVRLMPLDFIPWKRRGAASYHPMEVLTPHLDCTGLAHVPGFRQNRRICGCAGEPRPIRPFGSYGLSGVHTLRAVTGGKLAEGKYGMDGTVRNECARYRARRIGGRPVSIGPAARPADTEAPARGRGGVRGVGRRARLRRGEPRPSLSRSSRRRAPSSLPGRRRRRPGRG